MALLAPAATPDDPVARARAELQRVAAMPAQEQRAWLLQLEQRLVWASRLSMKPEEAAKEQARVAAVLRQKAVSWESLTDLLRLLEQREKAAVGRLVRQYRSQVYETFRRQDRVLVERQEAWYRVWSLWEAAGSPASQQNRLLDWLEAAIRSSMPDAIGPLPPDPKFGAASEPPALVIQKPAAPAERPQSRLPDITVKPPEPAPVAVRVPDSVAALPEAKPAAERVVPHRAEETSPAALLPDTLPAVVVPPQKFADREGTAEPMPGARLPERPSRLTVLPPNLDVPSLADVSIAGGAPPSQGGSLLHVGPQNETRQPAELPRPLAVESELPEKPEPSLPPLAVQRRPQATPAASQPGEVGTRPRLPSEHDMTAMLPRNVPEGLLSQVASDGPQPPAKPSEEPAPPKTAAAPPDEHVQVNVEELAARIAGVNLAMRTLEADLDQRREWNADQLDTVLNRLDILVLRQKDLSLFRDLVGPADQAKAGKIEPPRQAITALAALIVEARKRIRVSEAAGAAADRETALKHLDELSDRLAALATEK